MGGSERFVCFRDSLPIMDCCCNSYRLSANPPLQTETRIVGFPSVVYHASYASVELTISELLCPDAPLSHAVPRPLLHLIIPSPSSVPPSTKILPLSYTFEPCLTLNKNRGPITLALQRYHTFCTFRKRPTLLECSSARFSTVRETHPTIRPPAWLTMLVRFI